MSDKIPATEVIEQLGRGGDSNMTSGSTGFGANNQRRRSSGFSGSGIMEGSGDSGIFYGGGNQRNGSLGGGGSTFKSLETHRRQSMDKANEFQQQYAKDGVADRFKSWFK
ncbi:hypothetical protein INT43_008788 [Umbelopsis isabellina]|uniref:Uncharacterized protein n=1 Tax=Mortierella isabellina TaxID=91625 RepID=A0A8H7UD43_MORIS|nr:hypothetical protein INT43_008788 [Umbelopsis isabellina]